MAPTVPIIDPKIQIPGLGNYIDLRGRVTLVPKLRMTPALPYTDHVEDTACPREEEIISKGKSAMECGPICVYSCFCIEMNPGNNIKWYSCF